MSAQRITSFLGDPNVRAMIRGLRDMFRRRNGSGTKGEVTLRSFEQIARTLAKGRARFVLGPARRAFLAGVDSIEDLRRREPEFDSLRSSICVSGTDDLETFGRDYTHEGGLFLQQNPDEFAALCLLLAARARTGRYLEIGSASGGACLLLQRRLGFDDLLSLDDGLHRRAESQDRHFAQIPNCLRFVGNSHSSAARDFVQKHAAAGIDVAFIDGDHSYAGVSQDIALVRPFCRAGSLLILHDTIACRGVQRAWRELCGDERVRPLAEYIGHERPLGIGVAAIC